MDASGALTEYDPATTDGRTSRGWPTAATVRVAPSMSPAPVPYAPTRRQPDAEGVTAGPTSEVLQGTTKRKGTKSRRRRLLPKDTPAPHIAKESHVPKPGHTSHPDLRHLGSNEPSTSGSSKRSVPVSQDARPRHGTARAYAHPRRIAQYPTPYDGPPSQQEYARHRPYKGISLHIARQAKNVLLPQSSTGPWSMRRNPQYAEQLPGPSISEHGQAISQGGLQAGHASSSQVTPHERVLRRTETLVMRNEYYPVQGISSTQPPHATVKLSSYSSLSGAFGEEPVAVPVGPLHHAANAAPQTTQHDIAPESQPRPQLRVRQQESQTATRTVQNSHLRHHPYARLSNTRRQQEVQTMSAPSFAQDPESWWHVDLYQDHSGPREAAAVPYTYHPDVSYADPVASSSSMQHHNHDTVGTTHPVYHAHYYAAVQETTTQSDVPSEILSVPELSYALDSSDWAPPGSATDPSVYTTGEELRSYLLYEASMLGRMGLNPGITEFGDVTSIPRDTASHSPATDAFSLYPDELSFATPRKSPSPL